MMGKNKAPVSLRLRRGGSRRRDGFTLIELLIVIAILAILAAAVVIVINPAEMLAEARDAERISSIKSIKDSVDLFIVDNPSVSMGTSQTVYISLPDTSSTCVNISGLPTLPLGWVYGCVTTANSKNINGTGWIPLDFSTIKGGSPMPYLPIDPTNDLATGRYYTYVIGGSYELTALMEAQKTSVSISDGGSLPGVYQVGSRIGITPPTRDKGLIGYWNFDNGVGSITNGQTIGLTDSSGKGNNGTASNINGTGMNFTTGQIGNAIQFDGVDDYIDINTNQGLSTNYSVSWWIKNGALIGERHPIGLGSSSLQCYLADASSTLNLIYTGTSLSFGSLGSSWQLMTFTSEGGVGTKVFLNGVQINSSPNAFSLPTSNLDIGKRYGMSYYYPGMIDDVRLYNRPLSASEIKSIYDATR